MKNRLMKVDEHLDKDKKTTTYKDMKHLVSIVTHSKSKMKHEI